MPINAPQILIVDDVAANRIALRKILRDYDAEIVEADSGIEALKHAVNLKNLALILLDVQMPEMDGYEVAEILREEDQTNHIPIIFITAVHRDESHVLKGYSSGAVDYIPKPIDPDILRSKVSIFLKLWRMRAELEQEIQRRVEAEQKSYHLARHDELTSLYNRRALMELFAGELNRASRTNTVLKVLMIDLDGFKAVNDNLGHEAGDITLIEVASRLHTLIRNYDILARAGGDEFVILMVDMDDPLILTKKIADIIDKVTAPIEFNGQLIQVGVSIGIAEYPGDGCEINELLRHADKAMYAAKRLGGNRIQHYNPNLSDYSSEE
ncbi:MAG: diguanylate cyclase [Pseudomonadales bacterium]|nr:diguanylate cyclase [Pseudomonadales bacterium]NRA16686.1 diguanylate cyclase [Oceanospirillaceae bacterium]